MRTRYAPRQDGKFIFSVYLLKQSEIPIIFIVAVRLEVSFRDRKQSFPKYAQATKKHYAVRTVNVSEMSIVSDLTLLNILQVNSMFNYLYIA